MTAMIHFTKWFNPIWTLALTKYKNPLWNYCENIGFLYTSHFTTLWSVRWFSKMQLLHVMTIDYGNIISMNPSGKWNYITMPLTYLRCPHTYTHTHTPLPDCSEHRLDPIHAFSVVAYLCSLFLDKCFFAPLEPFSRHSSPISTRNHEALWKFIHCKAWWLFNQSKHRLSC